MDRVQIIGLVSSIFLLGYVLELVRRRKLREEYSWLWLLTAVGYLVTAAVPGFTQWVARLIGATRPTSAFTFLALFFLSLLCIQFSIRLSNLTERSKHLTQQLAILDSDVQELRRAWEEEDDLQLEDELEEA
ncbi:MAG: DUF2304 domain-containing protein [Chloroflexota bacterium]